MIQPLGDRVLVKEIKVPDDHVTSFGIIVASDKVSRHNEGEVVAVGPGRMCDVPPSVGSVTGTTMFTLVPMSLAVGDKVIFTFGDEYTLEGQKYYILRESDVLAKIM